MIFFISFDSLLWQNLIWIHYSVRVKDILYLLHILDHCFRFRILKEACLLKADTVLSADAAFHVTDEIHNESVDHCVQFGLQGGVLVAGNGDMQV